ncbi:alpha/beta fold hydrolase [Cytophagaceae bacterium DM2B3-1]|uniref:Alpha/beta fold hydrolase n=1 Tax=Xanthocytophaga flava TaxID=3048013 RepID=A0ABT7CMJ5_9BACT|nr:alpha/beta fold hydrolase [Xanthocytophaga flavus]MDJ1467532.1 alpha/beta fold hydrolase [Xanthocytophaga flavus]MDJ1494905.1 alpha/beta fold hydrolase [Xanthocytophaga flavus]
MSTISLTAPSYPNWLNRQEYPFKSNYFTLPVGRMHYVDQGEGEPVVMLHGNPGWSFEYRNVIKHVSFSMRCIVPDLIGFGLSDKPFNWSYLPEEHASNIELFLDSLNLSKITLVVNDWGGPIGLSYAIRYPQKIKKIILLNTWLWPVDQDPHFVRFSKMMGGEVGRFLITHFNIFGKVVVRQAVGDKRKLTSEIHRHYYQHLEKKSDRKGCTVFPKEIVGSSEWLKTLWAQREKINHIPTTIIWGMKDIAFRPTDLEQWITSCPQAKVIRLNAVGHFPQEEAPEIIVQQILSPFQS